MYICICIYKPFSRLNVCLKLIATKFNNFNDVYVLTSIHTHICTHVSSVLIFYNRFICAPLKTQQH